MRKSDERLFQQVDRNLEATAANVKMRRLLMLVWIAFVIALALFLGLLAWIVFTDACT